MNLQLHTLGEHVQLLQKNGLLTDPAAPIPQPGRKVALVSCDSQYVVPGTLFLCKGAHFKARYLQDAIGRAPSPTSPKRPMRTSPRPASR